MASRKVWLRKSVSTCALQHSELTTAQESRFAFPLEPGLHFFNTYSPSRPRLRLQFEVQRSSPRRSCCAYASVFGGSGYVPQMSRNEVQIQLTTAQHAQYAHAVFLSVFVSVANKGRPDQFPKLKVASSILVARPNSHGNGYHAGGAAQARIQLDGQGGKP